LLKVSKNCAPKKASIDLNLCARVASIHVVSPVVFVRDVRTPLGIVASRLSGCNNGPSLPRAVLAPGG
jgi:hypothetical protein